MANPIRIDKETRTYLKEVAGYDYVYAVPGYANDGIVGFINGDGHVDLFYKQEDGSFLVYHQSFGVINSRHFSATKRFSDFFHHVDSEHDFQTLGLDKKKLMEFKVFYKSLSPALKEFMKGCYTAPIISNTAEAFLDIGLVAFYGAGMCENAVYHESAHVLTHQLEKLNSPFIKKWQDLFNQGKNALPEDPNLLEKYGFISMHAAFTNIQEDISEMVGKCYHDPAYVRSKIENPLIKHKVQLLFEYGYIREDQYQYLIGITNELPKTYDNHCNPK